MATITSVIDKLKIAWQQFDLKKWADSIGGSSAQAVQAAVYFGVSFAIGFLFKKYFKFLFLSLIVSTFIILLLHYNRLVIIDIKAIKALIGVGDAMPGSDINSMINKFFDWVRDNMLFFISSVVGFFVGYKLG
jgi:uncharacterized membrane protein (Fun14 family)